MRFRSFAPYTLPGVLALIGWWWYTSRKKARPASLQAEEEGVGPAMGLLTSPAEGSNGLLEKACCQSTSAPTTTTIHRRPSRDRPKAPEPKSAEQSQQQQPPQQQEVVVVAAQVHSPLGRTVAPEPLSISTSTSLSLGVGRTEVPQVSVPHLRKGREAPTQCGVGQSQQQTPKAVLATGKSPAEAQRDAESSSDLTEVHAGMGNAGVTPDSAKQLCADVGSEAARLAATCADRVGPHVEAAAELTKDERPEPEGEVAAEETPHTQPTAPKPPQETPVAPCSTSASLLVPIGSNTKEDPAPTAATGKESAEESSSSLSPHPETPTAHLIVTSPLYTSTPIGTEDVPSEGKDQRQVENGMGSQLQAGGGGGGDRTHVQQEQEFERVAAGLITEVISAAAQQVQMTGSCEAATKPQATPVLNGRPYSADSPAQQSAADETDLCEQDMRPQGASTAHQTDKEMTNGCLTTPSTWEYCAERTAVMEQPAKATTPDSLRESPACPSEQSQNRGEDSGCCQSLDGISGDALPLHATERLPEVAPGVTEAPVQPSPSSSLGSSEADTPRLMDSPAPVVLEEAVLARHEAATALQAPLTAASLRNGGHAASEAEGDQSGGECAEVLCQPF